MTENQFRTLALKYPGAFESAHMGHPDFRLNGKIFATLWFPQRGFGMVTLTPDQQQSLVKSASEVFQPCAGAWGTGGATSVNLALVDEKLLRHALDLAAQNVAAKKKKKKET